MAIGASRSAGTPLGEIAASARLQPLISAANLRQGYACRKRIPVAARDGYACRKRSSAVGSEGVRRSLVVPAAYLPVCFQIRHSCLPGKTYGTATRVANVALLQPQKATNEFTLQLQLIYLQVFKSNGHDARAKPTGQLRVSQT